MDYFLTLPIAPCGVGGGGCQSRADAPPGELLGQARLSLVQKGTSASGPVERKAGFLVLSWGVGGTPGARGTVAPRTPVPSAGLLLGLLTCSASGPELPAPATEHSCEPAPPLPRWVGLTRIQATHRAPLRSPLSQSSKVGREPGPLATVRWAWGSRRAPPSPHRIKAELSAIFGEHLFAVHRRESTTRLWAWRRVGRGLCWGWGAPRAPAVGGGRRDAVSAPCLQFAPGSRDPSLRDGTTPSAKAQACYKPRDCPM